MSGWSPLHSIDENILSSCLISGERERIVEEIKPNHEISENLSEANDGFICAPQHGTVQCSTERIHLKIMH